jgi:DNA-nicking Smr family endonuclease
MRRLRADDRELWRRAMRDVAPLRSRSSARAAELSPDRERLAHPHPNPHPPAGEGGGQSAAPRRPQLLPPLDRFAGIDRATAERLKRGRYPVAARLDLHGMTQAEAHCALMGFVARSRAAGRRCLLVITGHGRMSGGILKAAVPRWLGEPDLRRHVLAIAPAQPDAGGSGALYVLLRRMLPAGD